MPPGEWVAKLLYNSAESSLKEQRRSLDELRSRTGALLSASSISNAFLAAVAAPESEAWHLPVRYFFAVIPFGLSFLACISILWYSGGWRFSLNTNIAREQFPNEVASSADYAALAELFESMNDTNERKLDRRSRTFSFAAAMLFVSVVAWLVLIK